MPINTYKKIPLVLAMMHKRARNEGTMADLTRSAKDSLATLYSEYRQRIKNGQGKEQAGYFPNCAGSLSESRKELKAAGYIQIDVVGNVRLTDKAIILMENKKKDAIKEGLSFLSQLKP